MRQKSEEIIENQSCWHQGWRVRKGSRCSTCQSKGSSVAHEVPLWSTYPPCSPWRTPCQSRWMCSEGSCSPQRTHVTACSWQNSSTQRTHTGEGEKCEEEGVVLLRNCYRRIIALAPVQLRARLNSRGVRNAEVKLSLKRRERGEKVFKIVFVSQYANLF